jgi:pimeloyl-ACP methyl ester carboxylesterase
MAERCAAAFVRQQLAIIGRPDSRPGLAGIACPAIVIAGRDDALMPPEIHDEQAAGIRGADLALLGDCGHLSSIEQPERRARLQRRLGVRAMRSRRESASTPMAIPR